MKKTILLVMLTLSLSTSALAETNCRAAIGDSLTRPAEVIHFDLDLETKNDRNTYTKTLYFRQWNAKVIATIWNQYSSEGKPSKMSTLSLSVHAIFSDRYINSGEKIYERSTKKTPLEFYSLDLNRLKKYLSLYFYCDDVSVKGLKRNLGNENGI